MQDNWQRYGIYYAPAADDALAVFGNAWLGRDPESGQDLPRPNVAGLSAGDIPGWTISPSRYGFHGTIKPPFALAAGKSREELEARLAAFAAGQKPIHLAPLRLKSIARFLVFALSDGFDEVGNLAADVVAHFDDFRAPPSEQELARRRMANLSDRQEALLRQWGYPYVMEEFRFHLTLTDRLDPSVLDRVEKKLADHCADLLARPFEFSQLCLYGDPGDGKPFSLLRRFPLSG